MFRLFDVFLQLVFRGADNSDSVPFPAAGRLSRVSQMCRIFHLGTRILSVFRKNVPWVEIDAPVRFELTKTFLVF